ncbi:MAG: hypothetical protein AAF393_12955 [Pseudomonadota bacterium]
MRFILLLVPLHFAACTPQGVIPNHQRLDFEYCERIARETFDAGRIRNDLCPGYMPDGQPVELFQ